MKNKIIKTALISAALLLGAFCNTQAQSNIARIIPGGIYCVEGWFSGPEIRVTTGALLENVHPDDWDSAYTGFSFSLWGGYVYSYYLDSIGLRTFFVKRNDVFSWEKIKSGAYEELDCGPLYNFEDSQIVYLGIYSGTSRRCDEHDGYYPGDENYWRYPDPLFGWVKLRFKDDGSYTLEDCAMGYKCKGIIIGTEELLVPTISSKIEGKTMTLTYSDSLYESEDGKTWTKVTDAEEGGTYTVDISKNGMKLYCSIMDELPSR
jgi:hypothetical protein